MLLRKQRILVPSLLLAASILILAATPGLSYSVEPIASMKCTFQPKSTDPAWQAQAFLLIHSAQQGDKIDYIASDINKPPARIVITYKVDNTWTVSKAGYSRGFPIEGHAPGTTTIDKLSHKAHVCRGETCTHGICEPI